MEQMEYLDIKLDGVDLNGKEVKASLSDLRGKNIVLYFYPKDETPVCTVEAGNFRDKMEDFPADTVVVGVSPDDISSHEKFMKNHKLNFHLFSDMENKLAKAFNNLDEQDKIVRSTFILDKDGKIIKEMRNIDIEGHVEKIIKFLKKQ